MSQPGFLGKRKQSLGEAAALLAKRHGIARLFRAIRLVEKLLP